MSGSPSSAIMTFQNAFQTPSLPTSYSGRAAAASAASSAVHENMTAMFARIFVSKPDKTTQKLVKKRPVANLAASTLAPSAFQRQAAGTASREPSHKPKFSLQAKPLPKEPQTNLIISNRISCDGSDVKTARSSSRHTVGPLDHQKPGHWRPGSVCSIGQADHPPKQQASRVTNSRAPTVSSSTRSQPSRTPMLSRDSRSPSSSSSIPAHSNPLRSSPSVATVPGPGPVNRGARSVQQIMGRRYTAKLSRMSVLPALPELTEEEQAFVSVLNSPITTLRCPIPRPAAPVNLPDAHCNQSRQLKARNDLVEFANELKAENAQLSVQLQDTVSQNIVATTQLEQQKKDNLALEETFKALWALVQPDNILETTQICQQVKLLSTSSQSQTTSAATTNKTRDITALERKLEQQTQQISSYRCSEAASRQLTQTLVHENKQMKARFDKVDAERLRLQTSLHAAEAKLERIERSLYVYPSSAQEILSGTASLLNRK